MLAMERLPGQEMRDRTREVNESLAQRDHSDGLYNLTLDLKDEDDQFDVDMTILDFLAYKTTSLVLEWRLSSDPHQSDLPSALVTMTAEWRNMLKHKYDGRRLNDQAAFRSRLLQFVLLFTHRLNHEETWTNVESLNEIRLQNRTRSDFWHDDANHAPASQNPFDTQNSFPLPDEVLAENRHRLASTLEIPPDKRRWVNDIEGTPSLHCLLPLFIELTAALANLDNDWKPADDWFNLAGEFMRQAVIEEYLLNGAYNEEAFNSIFAFGCPGIRAPGGEGADVQAMRTLFCNEEDPRQQDRRWAGIRQHFIDELLPRPGTNLSALQAMKHSQEDYPYAVFEHKILQFLASLHHTPDKPDLVQVEEGRITINGNELPPADSLAMIERMRL